MSDYLELGFFDDDDITATVHVMGQGMQIHAALEGVRSNLIRYRGYWTIDHDYYGRRASALIPAEDVAWFRVIEDEAKVTETVTLPDPAVEYDEPSMGSVVRCAGCGSVHKRYPKGWRSLDDGDTAPTWESIHRPSCGPIVVLHDPEVDG